MFSHVHIQNLRQYPGRVVTLKGWVVSAVPAGEGGMLLTVRDGTGQVRCIVSSRDIPPDQWDAARNLTPESSLAVTGKVLDGAAGQELKVTGIGLYQAAPPLVASPSPEAHWHLWARTPEGQALLRIRNAAGKDIRDYFDWNGYVQVEMAERTVARGFGPGAACRLDAAAPALGKVFSIAPVQRDSGGGPAAGWDVEARIAFAGIEDAMNVAEDFLSYLVHRLATEQADDLRTLGRNPVPLNFVKAPFPRPAHDDPPSPAAPERPVFLNRPPALPADALVRRDAQGRALSFDIFAPEGFGWIGAGAEYETGLETLSRQLRESGGPVPDWYLDLSRYGAAPRAGFAVSLDLFLRWFAGSR
ncbi:MAG: hypothetical protein KIT79_07100 [Deltaproteobacteria bacterium]|nr:hypothetical protein [Deltaproteobacteria bacterium]